MGIFDIYYGKKKEEEDPQSDTPKSFIYGDMLIYHMTHEQFDLKGNQLHSNLPDNVKKLIESWIPLYAFWTYKDIITKIHGNEFTNQMMVRVYSKCYEIEASRKEYLGFTNHLRNAFSMFDITLSDYKPQEVNGVALPIDYYAALSILVLDSNSPYYKNQNNLDNGLILDVAEVLESAMNVVMHKISDIIPNIENCK
jgi:hypothetical protein